ncbi:pectin acetylesterase 11-like [Salvia splendens]|uniref:pectin acetylesterase 11-like n=1 Tax=Salvia splendens TaxID=180675 RepID=UPI001C26EFE1|nr:pectin acetylesterase 11-like [Salvia splendens]
MYIYTCIFCLDGTPPGYAYSRGYGAGIDNWHIYLQALLSGGSAGGLARILHCDKFKTLFVDTTRVKCPSDSGFFIHGEHFVGADWKENRFFDVISTHGLANLLPTSCTPKFSPTLCFFPENLVLDVKTPLFLIESAFDQFQVRAIL